MDGSNGSSSGPPTNCIGLTWADETTLNGKPEQFFTAPDASLVRYDTLCANVKSAPGNDPELDALNTLLDGAFRELTEAQRDAFFAHPDVAAVEKRAERWARETQGDLDAIDED